MIIPYNVLSQDALAGLIKEYCLRDWGLNEKEDELTGRITQVENALRDGDLIVWYSEYEETAHLIASKDLPSKP